MNIDNKYSSAISEYSDSLHYICDIKTYELLYLNKVGRDLFQCSSHDDYKGKKCYDVIHGKNKPCDFCINDILEVGEKERHEYFNEKLNRWFYNSCSIINIDNRLCRVEVSEDITLRKKHTINNATSTEDILYYCLHVLANERDFATAINLILTAVGTYYSSNRAYIIEFDLKKELCSNTFEWCAEGVMAEIDNLQNLPLSLVDDWIKVFKETGEFAINLDDEFVDKTTDTYKILEAQGIHSLMATPLRSGDTITGFLGVDDPTRRTVNLALLRSLAEFIQDGLEKHRLSVKAETVRNIDSLTKLKNRRIYTSDIDAIDINSIKSVGVIIADINGMKLINDANGHKFGDLVIKRVGKIMKQHFPNAAYRIGGDEFAALVLDISKEDFRAKTVELNSLFEQNKECDVSVGYAWAENDGQLNIQDLLRQAEEIRRAEKQLYYHTVLKEGRDVPFVGYINEVMKELDENKFVVFYQPQICLKTHRVVGAEALVRKKDDNGNIIPPIKFIPFYEMSGVIRYVDLYVLRIACQTVRYWQTKGFDLHISVNMSRMTLIEPNIAETIKEICLENEISPSSIVIEVTESISKLDKEHLNTLFTNLKEAGFTISLDDFGSQYSNMSILSAVNFGEVKFDRTLVMDLENNHKSRAIIKNSIRLCKELEGTFSLAEGIETKEQLDILSQFECDYGQGYYFSRPITLEAFDEFIEKHNSLPN